MYTENVRRPKGANSFHDKNSLTSPPFPLTQVKMIQEVTIPHAYRWKPPYARLHQIPDPAPSFSAFKSVTGQARTK